LNGGGASLAEGNTTLTYHSTSKSLSAAQLPGGQVHSASMFGYFTVDSTVGATNWQAYDGSSFVLTINQTNPLNGSGSFVSTSITGSLSYDPSGGTDGGLVLTFSDPTKFQIPTSPGPTDPVVQYIVDREVFIGDGTLSSPGNLNTAQFGVGGTVAVPLPGVACAGMWLLGGVGGLRRLRRRAVA